MGITFLLGINWKTTLAGFAVIAAAFGRIAVAYRTKDFQAIFTDGQLVLETLAMLLTGWGLIKAKDQNVTGTGKTAQAVDSKGVVTDRDGDVVGQQSVLRG